MKKLVTTVVGASILLAVAISAQAAVIDLRTILGATGSDGTVAYTAVMQQPTGTGFIDPFVQIQNTGTEQAYNTTVNNVYDNKSANNFNHQITVGQVGFIDTNGAAVGGQVMRFFLDINAKTGRGSGINLDEVQVFISTTPNQSIQPPLAQGQLVPLANATRVYQLDGGGVDDTVLLDYALNGGGSGKGDMIMDIPLDLFTSAFTAGGFDTTNKQNGAYVYLYSRFSKADAGFEEWTYKPGDPLNKVPEPATMALLGLGLLGVAASRKRKQF